MAFIQHTESVENQMTKSMQYQERLPLIWFKYNITHILANIYETLDTLATLLVKLESQLVMTWILTSTSHESALQYPQNSPQ